jgi:type IV secretory pathway VirB4 component
MRFTTPTLRLPRHRTTTAHAGVLYPLHASAGLGPNGVYLGEDVAAGGGAFCFDPFQLYADDVLTAPNMIVFGQLGFGKSAFAKCFLHRSIGLLGAGLTREPRKAVIADPKGEYEPLAVALGLQHLRLYPGGPHRLNPLDAGGIESTANTAELVARHTGMLTALATESRRRPLTELEETAIGWAVHALLAGRRRRPPTLQDAAALLTDPTGEMAAQARRTPDQLARDVEGVRFAFERLLSGALRGMFDGHSTVALDWSGRGMVLDLSAVYGSSALGVVMVAATSWLQAVLFRAAGDTGRWYQVIDEAWALLGSTALARHYQASQKLARSRGVVNIAITHRVSDLKAQADDGTTAAKIAEGLLADTQTRVLFHQDADQIADARAVLGLSQTEADLLPQLVKGRALWKVADRVAVVRHEVAEAEWSFARTDNRMSVGVTEAVA